MVGKYIIRYYGIFLNDNSRKGYSYFQNSQVA